MKPISVSIYQPDYEAFKEAAKEQGRPVAHLIREAINDSKIPASVCSAVRDRNARRFQAPGDGAGRGERYDVAAHIPPGHLGG